MEIVINILLWLHLMGLVMVGGSLIGAGAIKMSSQPRDTAPAIGFKRLLQLSRIGAVVLIVTGPLMLWLKWGWVPPDALWFNIKMVFVVLVIVGFGWFEMMNARAGRGDAGAMRTRGLARSLTLSALVITVLAAAFAFG